MTYRAIFEFWHDKSSAFLIALDFPVKEASRLIRAALCAKKVNMATLDNDDLKAIKELMEVTIDEAIETKLVTKEDISHLPTKDEFLTKMDEVVGELKAVREEQPLQSERLSNHEDRIQKIEAHLGISSN